MTFFYFVLKFKLKLDYLLNIYLDDIFINIIIKVRTTNKKLTLLKTDMFIRVILIIYSV